MHDPLKSLPLNPLRAFAIASRHKSFTAAAAQMGVTQVAISRQIATLEAYLDVQLFDRGARSVRLTEQGRAFGQEIAPLFDQIDAAAQAVLQRERAQVINLRIYPTLAHHFLMPRLAGFTRRFPDYELRFDTTVEPLDFRSTPLDVAIQLGDGAWKDSTARILFPERLDVVCSPGYARRLQDADLCLLHSRYRRQAWTRWSTLSGIEVPATRETEFDSSLLTYSAALNGMGLAVGQVDLLQDDLRAGRLVTPYAAPQDTGALVCIVWPRTKSVAPQTRAFINWVLAEAGQAPGFSGL